MSKLMDGRFAIEDGDVHVWHVTSSPADDVFKKTLDEREKRRADRFKNEADARRFIAAHAATRFILARYLGIPPESIRYRYGAQGKPEIDNPNPNGIAFNQSHSGTMAIIAVTARREVGIDVEVFREDVPFLDIALRYFSSGEYSILAALPSAKLPGQFFRAWTRKEACLKASGRGLNLATNAIDVLPDGGSEPTIRATVEGSVWVVMDLSPAPGYVGAVAVSGGEVKVTTMEFTGSLK